MVKILYYLKCAKIFFCGKILCSTHQKKCFYKLLGSFWKIEFLTENQQPRTLQKWWKFCTISKCAKKIFFDKILCSTHQKICFYKLLGSFWKIEFLTENRQPRTLQKWWKFCTISKCAKFFLAKFFVPLSKRSVSTNFLGRFWKIEFLMENWQRRTLQKWWKFCTITNVLRIFFLWQMFLFHSSKEVFLQTFRQFLENWIFDGKSTAADLTKMVKILYYLKCAKNFFWAKFFVPLIKRSVSTNF